MGELHPRVGAVIASERNDHFDGISSQVCAGKPRQTFHYLQNGTVQATLVIFEASGIEEADVPDLWNQIGEVLLPEVRQDDSNLTFTVVMGRVLGAYQAERELPATTKQFA